MEMISNLKIKGINKMFKLIEKLVKNEYFS